jgi:hypothetical protein
LLNLDLYNFAELVDIKPQRGEFIHSMSEPFKEGGMDQIELEVMRAQEKAKKSEDKEAFTVLTRMPHYRVGVGARLESPAISTLCSVIAFPNSPILKRA